MTTSDTAQKTNGASVQAINTFKSSSDAQNFYRYVYENDLRHEAYMLLKYLVRHEKALKKKRRQLQ